MNKKKTAKIKKGATPSHAQLTRRAGRATGAPRGVVMEDVGCDVLATI